MKREQPVEQFKNTLNQEAGGPEESRDRTANPSTLLEIVLRRLAEISERSMAKDSGKPDLPSENIASETPR